MKILVTGGAGFIGSNLVDKLVQLGHSVIVLDNLSTGRLSNLDKVKNKIEILKIDITKNLLDNHFTNVDQVFHLAGIADIVPSIVNPKSYLDSNLMGTLNVLEASRKAKLKNLFTLPQPVVTVYR